MEQLSRYHVSAPNCFTLIRYIFAFCIFCFFHQCLIVFSVQVFHALVKFIPVYFILLDVIANGTIFLISLSDHVTSVWNHNWLLYTDFMSWNFTEFIIPKSFFRGEYYSIISSANSDNFTSSFLIWIPFIFLAWLFWLILPILYWIKMVRVDKFVLFLILEEKLLTFHYWV